MAKSVRSMADSVLALKLKWNEDSLLSMVDSVISVRSTVILLLMAVRVSYNM